MSRVLGEAESRTKVPIGGNVIEGVALGVACHQTQAMKVARGQGALQGVVV